MIKYIFLIILFTNSGLAKTPQLRMLDDLTKRVGILEEKVKTLEERVAKEKKNKTSQNSSILKTVDYNNKKIADSVSSNSGISSLSLAQQKELLQDLSRYEKLSSERQKFLDALSNKNP